jgi:flagellar hook-associated protein 1 FlgK
MINSADLFNIAQSGVRASNQLLETTANNIANVNTDGYNRQRTSFGSQLTGGVGAGTTERVINVFAQNQLRRDTTEVGEHETYFERSAVLDDIFASEASSISSSMSRFFGAIQTANDEPTNMSARQLVLGEANSMVGQINTLAGFLDDKERELNLEMDSIVTRANTLIESISALNQNIRVAQANNRYDEPGVLKDERDAAVLELAELMSIETRDNGSGDGSVMVNLTSGESLVLQDGSFNLLQLNGDPDPSHKSLQLASTGKPTALTLADQSLGGRLGGMFRYREEVLAPTQRDLGQIAISLAASMNQQNSLGMDFDQQLGGDIFSLPEFAAFNYADNSDLTLTLNGRISAENADQVTTADYQITIDGVTSGAPDTVDFTVALLNPDGSSVNDTDGNPITQSYTGVDAQSDDFFSIIGGLEIELPDGDSYAVGDRFLLQPTKSTAEQVDVIITRPEDLALASPIRVDSDINNTGDATLVSTSVTNTDVEVTLSSANASAFDGNGGLVSGTPARLVFNSETEFEIFDDTGASMVVVSGVTDYNNIIEQATADAGWPIAGLSDFPGYDFSLQGQPNAGDAFDIGYNTGGLNDNRNGLELAGLQNQDVVLLNSNGGEIRTTFHEAYASVVSNIGAKTAIGDIALQSAEAMKSQSQNWFESVSGVNLDEEAANLVRFQQTYAAAARVLSTAQNIFDTILNSTR